MSTTTMIEIETWKAPGDFQLRIRKGWDDALFIEVGSDWKPERGFGHPVLGRLKWELRGNQLFQRLPGSVVCHYPITVSDDIASRLRRHNLAAA